MSEPLRKYMKQRKSYSQSDLAGDVGRSQATINRWINGREKIPASACVKLEKVTGIPRDKLRPDIFGV